MSATMMTKNKRWKLHYGHSTHARPSSLEADDSAHKAYDQPIHSQKVIPDNYYRNKNDDE